MAKPNTTPSSALRRAFGVNVECSISFMRSLKIADLILSIQLTTKPSRSVSFPESIEVAPDEFELNLRALRPHIADDLRRKFPQEGFQSTSAWVQAVQNEIKSNLLPAVGASRRASLEIKILQSAAVLSEEMIKNELAVEERIDAMINGAIKRLVQTKAMKQMLSSASLKKPREKTARAESMPEAPLTRN